MKIASALLVALVPILFAGGPAVALKNDFSDQLKKLPEYRQRAVLRRAVLDGNQYCRRIGPVAYQGPYKNLEMWTVSCDRGATYGAFIGLDGSVQVRPCKDLATLKLPTCRLPK
ncbi:hypothetical protein [Sphingomonas sp. SRS2]|uniref:hypothetical protein n=1 Tax=Sphingomonas sp. SRS2 TaxID=133190 RepID=UPI00061842DE|nr:hypothetical protein [Sphingomonas sp. SRS2]KKC25637.1 hypothetical protein WP12_12560 [Sphingomonas sp. SRS2]